MNAPRDAAFFWVEVFSVDSAVAILRSPVLRGCFGESYVETSPCHVGTARFCVFSLDFPCRFCLVWVWFLDFNVG